MNRCLLSILAVATSCGGCASPSSTVAPKPDDLDARLARFEARQKTSEPEAPPREARSRRPDPHAARSQAPPAALGKDARAESISRDEAGGEFALQPWTLSDVGEAAAPEQSDAASDDELYWAEREEKYLRRPPLDSFWATLKRDLKHAHKDLWRDTKRVYGNPINLVILGTAYGGSLALQETGPDDTIEDHFYEDLPFGRGRVHRHMSSDWRDFFGAAGNPGTHFALAGLWYLVGQQTSDDKTYEVGKTLFSALAINGVTVMIGQTASFDRSPNGEWGTFPSGHTSSSFVVASVMHEAYGHLVGIPLYGLAALNAHERIESGEHYFSDVVMGAVLGTVVGHSVASGREPEFFGWKLVPWASPQGGSGVALVKRMK